jgi:hypothetical protein
MHEVNPKHFALFAFAMIVGAYFAFRGDAPVLPLPMRTTNVAGSSQSVPPHRFDSKSQQKITASRLNILRGDGSSAIIMGDSNDGEPGLWLVDSKKRSSVNMGVHAGNGFPFVLVSDGAIRNFGLGRVDGTQASPILVFRSDDIVRMVIGLNMQDPNQGAFLVHYSKDDKKHLLFGDYCDVHSRACL